MVLKLISLKLRNFKGQRDFLFEPNGKNASVFGDNGTEQNYAYGCFQLASVRQGQHRQEGLCYKDT